MWDIPACYWFTGKPPPPVAASLRVPIINTQDCLAAENHSHFFPASHSWADDLLWTACAFCLHLVSTAGQSITFAIQSDNNSQLLLEKRGKKGEWSPVLRASTAPAFYWTCPFHLFLGAIEGDFLRSAADALIVCFKTRTKNCLCGKSMPGLCLVVVISPVSPNYCPPQGKVYWRGILLLLWACNLSEPSTVSEWGQIREGRRERFRGGMQVIGMRWEGMCK